MSGLSMLIMASRTIPVRLAESAPPKEMRMRLIGLPLVECVYVAQYRSAEEGHILGQGAGCSLWKKTIVPVLHIRNKVLVKQ